MDEEEEERLALIEELERQDLIAQLAAQDEAEAAAPPEPEQSTIDKARGVAQSYNRGSMLGFGDEIVGGLRTYYDKLLYDEDHGLGDDVRSVPQSLEDTYEMYRDDERDVTETFADQNSKTALGLNLAGALLSPANAIPVSRGGQAIAGGGISSARAQRTAAEILRAGAEGTVAAIGESEADSFFGDSEMGWDYDRVRQGFMGEDYDTSEPSERSMLDDALGGFGWGAGTSIGLKGLGSASSRAGLTDWVGEKLVDEAGNFIPIHMVKESGLGDWYRNMVGRSIGGQTKLASQESRILDDVSTRAEDARKDLTLRKWRARQADRAEKRNIDRQKQYEVAQGTQQLDEVPGGIPAGDVSGEVEAVTQRLRLATAHEAIPEVNRVAAFDGVDMNDMDAVDDAVADWWNKDAFRMVKDKTDFDLDKGLRKQIDEVLEDPEAKFQLGDAIYEVAKRKLRIKGIDTEGMTSADIIDEVLSGEIDGEVLMVLRNSFAIPANAGGKTAGAQRRVARAFDKFIKDQLGGDKSKAAREYSDQLNRYTTNLAQGKAVGGDAASLAGGRYSVEDINRTGGRFESRGTDARKRPMRSEIRQAAADIEEIKGNAVVNNEARDTARAANEVAAASNRAVREEAQGLAQARKAGLTERTDARNVDFAEELHTGPVGQAKKEVTEMGSRATPRGQTGLSKRLSTMMLGDMATPRDTGALGSIIGGAASAAGMATEGFQKFLGSQTGWQEAVKASIERGDWGAVNRAFSRLAAQYATEENE